MAKVQRVENKKPEVIIQKIDIRQIQRTQIDIDKWRNAIKSAESVIMPRRILLYDLYFDIILDGHLSSVMDKRKTAVIKTPVVFSKDGNDIPEITKLTKSAWFQGMLTDLLDSKFWGHTLLEFQFSPDGTISYDLIPRKHVIPKFGQVVRDQADITGIPFRESPYTDFTLEAGDVNDLGLLMKAAQYVIYKRNCIADYAQYTELFGQPLRKGKYNPYDENTRKMLQESLEAMGSSPWVIYPEGTDIEFIEAKSPSGSGQLYNGLIEVANKEMSKLIVGQTLTTEAGNKGARSLGDVHMEVERDIHYSDRLFLKNILNNQFKKLLTIHGYNVDNGEFDFIDEESTSITDRIKVDELLKDIIPMADDYFYETYGVPKPDNYAELRKKLDEKNIQKQIPPAGNNPPPDNTPENKRKGIFPNFFVKTPR